MQVETQKIFLGYTHAVKTWAVQAADRNITIDMDTVDRSSPKLVDS